MQIFKFFFLLLLLAAIGFGGFVVFFHSEWIKLAPKPEEPDPVTDVAVQTVTIKRATLHRYIECFGSIGPEQRRAGGNEQSASARVASPVAGVVTEVHCAVGQALEKGAVLFQLDDRIARSEETKAEAAIASAQATVLKLKNSLRPEQITLAEIVVTKARLALEFARVIDERQKALGKEQLAPEKQLQESAQALASAREDLTTAEKQLALLKKTPAPEELAEAQAKVSEAEKTLAAAHLLRSLLTIKAPISGTALKVNINAGEPVDTTVVLAELADLTRLEASGNVPAAEMRWLKPGQDVEIRCFPSSQAAEDAEKSADSDDAFGASFNGKIVALGLQVDPKSDTVSVRAALPPNSGVKPGQTARLKIMVEERQNCLVVPEVCLFRDKTDIDVIAVIVKNKSVSHNAKPGLRENGLAELTGSEVRDGDIKEGDVVAAAGAYGLPDQGTLVHVVGTLEEKK